MASFFVLVHGLRLVGGVGFIQRRIRKKKPHRKAINSRCWPTNKLVGCYYTISIHCLR